MSTYTEGSNKGFKASADLTGHQYGIVKLDASRLLVKAAAATDVVLGTLLDKPTVGRTGDVRLRTAAGTSKVRVGSAAVAADAPLTSDANGLAVTASVAGQQIVGYAITAGAAGEVIEYLPSTAKF